MENYEISAYKTTKNEQRKKSDFTTPKKISKFNPDVQPFEPSYNFNPDNIINIGPSQVAVNKRIFDAIATNRPLPDIPDLTLNVFPLPSTSTINGSFYTIEPETSEFDRKRNVVIFKREFGPVATDEGVELRLNYGIRVFISVEGAVLVENGEIRISVSSNNSASAIEHPMGRIVQNGDSCDIIAYDGMARNQFIRYAKILKDSIALTSRGCALIYLLDTAGTRTTSELVNRDCTNDYCKKVYMNGMTLPNMMQTKYAVDHYRYRVNEDGTDIFHICNVRISQSKDGMVRIQSNQFSIRSSVENRNITLKTPFVYCTASMGTSPHLFIRMNERRVHFDGINFVSRNMGHSCSFDGANNLRIN